MNILYVLAPSITRERNGIKKQAEIWADQLIKKGHNVIKFSPWNPPAWENIDLIHLFGNGLWLIEIINSFPSPKIPIIISPIIDTFKPIWQYKFASYLAIPKLRLYSSNYAIRYIKDQKPINFLVRSEHEKRYVREAYGIEDSHIDLLRLPCRFNDLPTIGDISNKQDFCLHVSAFTQERKNVMALMKAAAKYNFNLVIAGSAVSEEDSKPFYDFAKRHPNIKILGQVTEEELNKLYTDAKVFALPSFDEGVGFVALEAASKGCNIVITKLGGPKEYYQGMAIEVDPFNIDDIGQGILQALKTEPNPYLKELILSKYNLDTNSSKLVEIYQKILER